MTATDTVAQNLVREHWLVVANAVSHDYMSAPDDLAVYPDRDIPSVELLYRAYRDDSYADAARAAHALGIPFDRDASDGTIRAWWQIRDGWAWAVRAYRNAPEGGAS